MSGLAERKLWNVGRVQVGLLRFDIGRLDHLGPLLGIVGCQIAPNSDPLFASKNDPFEGAETGGAEPHIAEQSRSWRAASGDREVMRGS